MTCKQPPLIRLGAPLALATVTSCQSASPELVERPASYDLIGSADKDVRARSYRLGPADAVRVTVAYEPEASIEETIVDVSGEIAVPLIGAVRVAGLTASEVAQVVRQRMVTYIRDPRVTVNVVRFAQQTVTVEGNVEAPGVYDIAGSSSLLQTLALAKGPTRTAKLNQVIVFRVVDGQRMGAIFDIGRIRNGHDPDPLILGGDTVVVNYSQIKGAFRDFLTAAPVIAVFRPF